jgi:hypothetical protein
VRRARSKYRAIRTDVDGVAFASKREAADYCELKIREKLGEIADLELQPEYPIVVISPIGEVIQVGVYKADFRFREVASGERIVTDSKGFKTPVYRLKKKLVEAIYGILILET